MFDKFDKSDLEGPEIDRRTAVKLFAAGGISSLAGCAGGSSDPSGGDTGDAETGSESASGSGGGSITAGWNIDQIEYLDPHYIDKGQEIYLSSNVYSGLVKIGADGSITGDLAKNWTLPDSSTYVFDLKEGATFHNGDPLDAEAVKASFERLMSLDDSPHLGKVSSVEEITAEDPTTLRISLSETVGPFISFLTRGPGRAGTIVHAPTATDNPEEYNRMPVGSGAFEVTERESGEYLQLEAHDGYFGTDSDGTALPYLDSVRIDLIPEPSTMWTAIQGSELDYSISIPPQNAGQAESMGSLSVTGSNPGAWFAVAPLCTNPAEVEWDQYASGEAQSTDKWSSEDLPTTSKEVRQAISMAIDREALVERAFFGYAEPAHSVFNPAIAWLHDQEPDPGQYYDPDTAKQLLDEAGYTGEPRMSLSLLGTPGDERRMTVVQSMLSEVGIEVELNIQPSSAYWDNLYQYSNELVMYDGYVDIDPWMSLWKQLKTPVESGSAGKWQANLYNNPEFNSLLEEDLRTSDPDSRTELLRQAEEIFIEDTPWAMTTFPLIPKAASSSLSGVGNQAGLSNFHTAQIE
ncbi:ABC transporter substrate-binding protein [Haloquadratum walsbyi]|jgi:ABC-type dipeptide transport system, periplasmic component|uniref:ABC-type dipeptide transport system, periplasmic component n=1 Tax=Haloquadratum walsbyi J07HQW2 TaxID=1238425 RepID=U1NH12_9EURY|nr:ABC transporter substrate-binding protein [Haloquadratum walsbyi]ERG96158.1 MAG: ABC-type dipeptide transport system, periplasmic component [Haloquadratum walsbyi J07HQW2]